MLVGEKQGIPVRKELNLVWRYLKLRRMGCLVGTSAAGVRGALLEGVRYRTHFGDPNLIAQILWRFKARSDRFRGDFIVPQNRLGMDIGTYLESPVMAISGPPET